MTKDCRHIKTDGRKCGSPALHGEYYCYYHHPRRRRAASAVKPRYFLEIPLLDHRGAVRAALGEICRALADGEIDVELGGRLLYALQLATSTNKGTPQVKQSSPRYLKIAPAPGLTKIYTTRKSPDTETPTRGIDLSSPSATSISPVLCPHPPCLQ